MLYDSLASHHKANLNRQNQLNGPNSEVTDIRVAPESLRFRNDGLVAIIPDAATAVHGMAASGPVGKRHRPDLGEPRTYSE